VWLETTIETILEWSQSASAAADIRIVSLYAPSKQLAFKLVVLHVDTDMYVTLRIGDDIYRYFWTCACSPASWTSAFFGGVRRAKTALDAVLDLLTVRMLRKRQCGLPDRPEERLMDMRAMLVQSAARDAVPKRFQGEVLQHFYRRARRMPRHSENNVLVVRDCRSEHIRALVLGLLAWVISIQWWNCHKDVSHIVDIRPLVVAGGGDISACPRTIAPNIGGFTSIVLAWSDVPWTHALHRRLLSVNHCDFFVYFPSSSSSPASADERYLLEHASAVWTLE